MIPPADHGLEVVGITGEAGALASFSGPTGLIPPDVLPITASAGFTLYAFQVPESDLNRALAELSAVIIALAIDVQFIDGLIGRLIEQFAAIPTIVGLLSLFAASVIMANTVALSTLERRRQIGILKAIGLKARRVLLVMFIESSVVGLLSAIIGVGLSALLIQPALSRRRYRHPPAKRRASHRRPAACRRCADWLDGHISQRPRRPQRAGDERAALRLANYPRHLSGVSAIIVELESCICSRHHCMIAQIMIS